MVVAYLVYSVVVAWVAAVLIKTKIAFLRTKKFSLSAGFNYGGMPSGHSTVVVSLAAAIFVLEGFTSLFALAAVFSIVTISDLLIIDGNPKTHTLRRHTIPQVLAGSLLGILSAVVFGVVMGVF